MDQFAVAVSAAVNRMEELRLPVVPYGTYFKAVCIGVPIAVLAHDTAAYWLPTKVRIPIVSWFMRRWRLDPEAKHEHIRAIRNLFLFAFAVVVFMDDAGGVKLPCDYVSQRLTSQSGQRAVNQEIYKARRNAFNVASTVMGEEEMNSEGVQQQRDAALRRRHLHDPSVN